LGFLDKKLAMKSQKTDLMCKEKSSCKWWRMGKFR
jgi:hypothetical protein